MRNDRPNTKRAENHGHSVAIRFMHHNFVRIHQSLRITPAMAALHSGFIASLTERGLVVTIRGSQPIDLSNLRGSIDATQLFDSPAHRTLKR
jgi:hypothetical protein